MNSVLSMAVSSMLLTVPGCPAVIRTTSRWNSSRHPRPKNQCDVGSGRVVASPRDELCDLRRSRPCVRIYGRPDRPYSCRPVDSADPVYGVERARCRQSSRRDEPRVRGAVRGEPDAGPRGRPARRRSGRGLPSIRRGVAGRRRPPRGSGAKPGDPGGRGHRRRASAVAHSGSARAWVGPCPSHRRCGRAARRSRRAGAHVRSSPAAQSTARRTIRRSAAGPRQRTRYRPAGGIHRPASSVDTMSWSQPGGMRIDRDRTVTVFQPHVCYAKVGDEGIGSSVASR